MLIRGEASHVVMRIVGIVTVPIRVGLITLSGGAAVVRAAPVWQESLRYFRLSQVSDDLLDAYRKLHLALESTVDAIAPQLMAPSGSPAEGEGAWFKRALGEAANLIDLKRFAPAGAADPVEALRDELYRDRRTAIFHAQSSSPYVLPHGKSAPPRSL
jgi:hypothetical protein